MKHTPTLLAIGLTFTTLLAATSQSPELIKTKIINSNIPQPVIERCQKKLKASNQEMREITTEFKKYLTLAALHPQKSIIMLSEKVDELWHTFILFTKDYAQYCKSTLGYFLHHTPYTSHTTKERRKESTKNFYHFYQTTFGSTPPQTIWKAPFNVKDCSNCDSGGFQKAPGNTPECGCEGPACD